MKQSAFKELTAALTKMLSRPGVFVGETAGYPRVEIHTITENERLDKAGKLRLLTATIETITSNSLVYAHELNDDNLRRIDALKLSNGFSLLGSIPTQLQTTSESSDTQTTLYRMMQSVDFYIENNE